MSTQDISSIERGPSEEIVAETESTSDTTADPDLLPVTTPFAHEQLEDSFLTPIETRTLPEHIDSPAVISDSTEVVSIASGEQDHDLDEEPTTEETVPLEEEQKPDILSPRQVEEENLDDLLGEILSHPLHIQSSAAESTTVEVEKSNAVEVENSTNIQNSTIVETDLQNIPLDDEPVFKEAKIFNKQTAEPSTMETNPLVVDDTSLHHICQPSSQRDPKAINSECVVQFEDVIGEPNVTGAVPRDFFNCTQKTFLCCHQWMYYIMSVVIGGPASLYWGMHYACMASIDIWCCTPCTKAFRMQLNMYKRIWGSCMQCICDPVVEALNKLTIYKK